jgi:chorismate mutase
MDQTGGGDGGRALACRGVRGATVLADASQGAMDEAAAELLAQLLHENGCGTQDVAAAVFTLPEDLIGTNPASSARAAGWEAVPLLAVREHGGDDRVPRCLRILLMVNTTRSQSDVRHVYLREAAVLRPDLARSP